MTAGDRLRYEAPAEIVILRCSACGHKFSFVGDEPTDRESVAACPAKCGPEGCVGQYRDWVVRDVALIFPDRIVFFSAEDAEQYRKEVISV